MRFLVPHSASEGPHLVPISLKIGSPLGPHFDRLGSPWHVATVVLVPATVKKDWVTNFIELGHVETCTVPTSPGDPLFSKWGPDGDPNFSEMGTKWGPSPAEWGPKKRMFAKLIETS